MGKKIIKTVSHRLQFIDSARFMATSLSSLFNNIAERIHENEGKLDKDTMIKNVKLAELNTKISTAFLNTETLKMT